MSKLELKFDSERSCLSIVGAFTGNFELENQVITNLPEKFTIDFGLFKGVSKDGVSQWKEFIKSLNCEANITLKNVPTSLINLACIIPAIFPANYVVESFFAPCKDPESGSFSRILIKSGEHYQQGEALPSMDNIKDPTGNIVSLDIEKSNYFNFLPESDINRYSPFHFFQSVVIVIDENKNIKFGNDFAANISGASVKRLCTKNIKFYELIKLDSIDLFCMKNGLLGKDQQTQIQEYDYKTKKGVKGSLQVAIYPDVNSPSYRKRWIVYMHDVSLEIQLKNKYTLEQQNKAEAEAEKEEFFNLATTDKMTGLKNYRAFIDRFELELGRSRRSKKPLGIVILDIDHFKKFNDTHGHQQGDKVLKVVAEVLSSSTRETDFVARYGGEEFVFLFPGTHEAGLVVVMEKIRKNLEETQVPHIDKDGEFLSVTASLGGIFIDETLVSGLHYSEEVAKAFISIADKNLYICKENGRNCSKSTRWDGTIE
jgi:diguanylate cyclase (GGDEF)-like protein